jgi:uncharacterized protein YraI
VTTPRSWLAAAAAFVFGISGMMAVQGATALSKADRVNVRSRPGFSGEVVTQLRRGQEVTVLNTVTLRRPGAEEPPVWLKIELAEGTPVWANAEFIERESGRVKADLLNLRAGPTYDHAIVGRVKQGTVVKVLGPDKDGWVQVGSPAGAFGFVPASWLTAASGQVPALATTEPARTAPAVPASPATAAAAVPAASTSTTAAPTPAPAPATATVPAPAPTAPPPVVAGTRVDPALSNNAWLEQFVTPRPEPVQETVQTEAAPTEVLIEPSTTVPSGGLEAVATTDSPGVESAAEAAAVAAEASDPGEERALRRRSRAGRSSRASADGWESGAEKARAGPELGGVVEAGRWVRREGLVVTPLNVTAPSYYALKARDGGRLMNYLMSPGSGSDAFREYRGRVVIVTGREYLDGRPFWRDTPMLDVETIEAVR